MFEFFNPRKEELTVLEFENWKIDDEELQELAIAVTSKMAWETEDGEEGEETAMSFIPEDGYEEALRNLQRYLDKKGRRYTDQALATALAEIMDVGDYGYAYALPYLK